MTGKQPPEPMGVVIRGAPRMALTLPGRGADGGIDIPRLIAAFLSRRNQCTRAAYEGDLDAFRSFLGALDVNEAVGTLLALSHGEANYLALGYQTSMVNRGLSTGTVNRRISSLRSLVKAARVFGMIPWTLEVERLPAQSYRDTRGPGHDGVLTLLAKLRERTDPKGLRDMAIIRLLYERALRSNEVRSLDLADVDFVHGKVNILGKGRTQKEWLTIAPSTLAALRAWVDCRGEDPGPLFTRFHYAYGRGRIGKQGMYRVVKDLGESADIRVRPHGLRHAAITEALDRGEPIRSVHRFSRHKNPATLMIYDDNRQDLGGEVACVISEPDPAPKHGKRATREVDAAAKAATAGLDPQTVRRIAAEARCDGRTVLSIARGTVPRQESGHRATGPSRHCGLRASSLRRELEQSGVIQSPEIHWATGVAGESAGLYWRQSCAGKIDVAGLLTVR